jgi:transposase InsO family protein
MNETKLEEVSNSEIIEVMKGIQADPDLRCGSKRMKYQLALHSFTINKKKVARLMRENLLLFPRRARAKKTYVAYRIIAPDRPLSMLQMDIKHFWIVRDRRSAYVLTVLDTFTKETLGYHIGFHVTSKEVKQLWDKIISDHLEPAGLAAPKLSIEIRNDGGPQFASGMIQAYFKDNGLDQVFTHPYTPEENGHIESFHSIVASCVPSEFFKLSDLIKRMERFYETYNSIRAHGSNKGLPPLMFRKAFEAGFIDVQVKAKNKVEIKLLKPLIEIPRILSRREHLAKSLDFNFQKKRKGDNVNTAASRELAALPVRSH